MEDNIKYIEDIPVQDLPRFLKNNYRACPTPELANYINRVVLGYNRENFNTSQKRILCRFSPETSEFDEESIIFLNFSVRSYKDLGLNLKHFLNASEVKQYELYDIGVDPPKSGDTLSSEYDEYGVTVWFKIPE